MAKEISASRTCPFQKLDQNNVLSRSNGVAFVAVICMNIPWVRECFVSCCVTDAMNAQKQKLTYD